MVNHKNPNWWVPKGEGRRRVGWRGRGWFFHNSWTSKQFILFREVKVV
jgi:hypothetical protein